MERSESRQVADEVARSIIDHLDRRNPTLAGRLSILIYTEDMDPNGLLNTPDGYTSAANILDTQLGTEFAGINSGCVVEAFDSPNLAEDRFLRIGAYSVDMGNLAQRVSVAGGVLLRIPELYDEFVQEQFIDVFREIAGYRNLEFTADRDISNFPPDNPHDPIAQADTIAAIKEAIPKLAGISDERLRSILLTLCSMQSTGVEFDTYFNYVFEMQAEFREPPVSADVTPEEIALLAGLTANLCPTAIGWLTALIQEAVSQQTHVDIHSNSRSQHTSEPSWQPTGDSKSSFPQTAGGTRVRSGRRCVKCGTGADENWAYCGICGSPLQ